MNADAVTAFECAMIVNVGMAAMLFTFITSNTLEPRVARRMFTATSVFVALVLASSSTPWPRIGRYLLASFGMQLINGALEALGQHSSTVRKRAE